MSPGSLVSASGARGREGTPQFGSATKLKRWESAVVAAETPRSHRLSSRWSRIVVEGTKHRTLHGMLRRSVRAAGIRGGVAAPVTPDLRPYERP